MDEEVLVDGYASPIAGIQTKITKERIEFSSNGSGRLLTNPLMTDNGQTIGERNRAYLHAKLDAWLDKTFEEPDA